MTVAELSSLPPTLLPPNVEVRFAHHGRCTMRRISFNGLAREPWSEPISCYLTPFLSTGCSRLFTQPGFSEARARRVQPFPVAVETRFHRR
jgi:hypothetical protein